MRSFPILLFSLLFHYFTAAQTTGKITYEEKVDLHRNIPEDRPELKNMIPQFNTARWELTYTDNESVYQRFVEKELTGVSSNQPGYFRYGRENRVVYKNFSDDKLVDSREFMQKQFLIKGFTSSRRWKIGKNQKEIAGYNCMDATIKLDSVTTLKAWYAPKINVSNGPVDYQGLPGMILQIDINDGERLITATDIMLKDADPSVIIIPTKGKEVTSEEFDEIKAEKMKEMNAPKGGSAPVMIFRPH